MDDNSHGPNVEETPTEETVAQSRTVPANFGEEKQGVLTEQTIPAVEACGKEPTGQPIPANGHDAKYLALAFLLLLIPLIAIIIAGFSSTPAITQADSIRAISESRDSLTPVSSGPTEVSPRIEAIDAGFTEVTPRIEAICFSDDGESSIYIQGEFAREGDIVDGFTILKIYPGKVEFDKNGETVIGTMSPPP